MLPAFLIIIGIFGRMVEHPMNFTPVLAVALFSGAYIKNKNIALLLPLALMIITDLFIGFHETILATWLSMLAVGVIGFWVRKKITVTRAAAGSLLAAALFFVVTNFASWFFLYEISFKGLMQCYVAAIPFFRNTLMSTFLYTMVLFGSYEMAAKFLKSSPNSGFWLVK